jgi:hypothetical protein
MVPVTGGLYSGDTTTMLNDLETTMCGGNARSADAAFRLDLPAGARVTASTSGSAFDTVLHMHQASCASRMEEACDDDGIDGSASFLDRTLGAGTYFFVVDGFGDGSVGRYELEITVTTP